jgi:hypothetical protein
MVSRMLCQDLIHGATLVVRTEPSEGCGCDGQELKIMMARKCGERDVPDCFLVISRRHR